MQCVRMWGWGEGNGGGSPVGSLVAAWGPALDSGSSGTSCPRGSTRAEDPGVQREGMQAAIHTTEGAPGEGRLMWARASQPPLLIKVMPCLSSGPQSLSSYAL